ncbi:DUF4365 domain-containing protein [Vibrio cholerae]|uniref:DUF4365 domain-containing protein n=1 Tax=Vibrio cholerae TaxID=666 RepID=UPI001C2F1D47
MQLPQRDDNHRLEGISELFFRQNLPQTWTAHKPDPDYGVDLIVDIFDGNNATGRELLIQLKSSQESNVTVDGEFERITLNVSTYNMLWDKLQVVMLVKYVASENQAYWQLLSEVPAPNEENQTISVRMPRANVLGNIEWEPIRNYVEAVHLRKLRARDRFRFSEFA